MSTTVAEAKAPARQETAAWAASMLESLTDDKLIEQGGVFTETFGWERPKWFSVDGREEEYSYRRNNVFDLVADPTDNTRLYAAVEDAAGHIQVGQRILGQPGDFRAGRGRHGDSSLAMIVSSRSKTGAASC